MKNTLIFFFVLLFLIVGLSICSNAQTEIVGADGKIYKLVSDWQPQLLPLKDSVYSFRTKGNLYAIFEGKTGVEYSYTVTRKLYVVPNVNAPIKVEAESAVSIVNAAVVGTVVGNIKAGMILKYAAVDMGTRTKLLVRYSRGYPAAGFLTFKIGSTSNTFTFPSTGSWTKFEDIEFNFQPSSGVIEINSSVLGAANIDFFEFK